MLLGAFGVPGARAQETFWPYRVEPGDTLIGIRDTQLRPGADWRELQRVNRLANPRRLMPGSTLQIPVDLLRERALVAEVLHAHGEVSVLRPGGEARRLVGGESLAAGDQVRTGPQSSAALRFADGSRVLLRPDSALRIQRTVGLGASPSVQTELRLDSGSVDTRVVPKHLPRFEIRTPVANLGVRGTVFRTRTSDTQTAVEVLDGRVAAAVKPEELRDSAPLEAGFGSVASERGLDAPRRLASPPALTDLPERVERLPLRLAWGEASGAAAYRAQVYAADDPDRLLLDGQFVETAARWGEDLPDGRYELRVRAIDSSGLEGFDASRLFTLKARPEAPFTIAPRAGTRTGDDNLQFSWTRSIGAARYRLQVAADPGFSTLVLDRSDLGGDALRVPLPVGTYYWRIASIRADGDAGPWGDVQVVTRVAQPAPPASEPPQTTGDGVLLSWGASTGASYRVQVASDAGFAQLLHDERVDSARWLLRSPEPGSYFVRVQTIDADGFSGPFGAVQQVDIARSPWWWLLAPALLLLL